MKHLAVLGLIGLLTPSPAIAGDITRCALQVGERMVRYDFRGTEPYAMIGIKTATGRWTVNNHEGGTTLASDDDPALTMELLDKGAYHDKGRFYIPSVLFRLHSALGMGLCSWRQELVP
jgi:hypothetical protein